MVSPITVRPMTPAMLRKHNRLILGHMRNNVGRFSPDYIQGKLTEFPRPESNWETAEGFAETPPDTNRFTDQRYFRRDLLRATITHAFNRFDLSRHTPSSLDAGCGPAVEFLKYLPKGLRTSLWRVMDINPESIKEATELIQHPDNAICESFDNLGALFPGEFSLITLFNAVDSVPNISRTLSSIAAALKPRTKSQAPGKVFLAQDVGPYPMLIQVLSYQG